MRAIRLAALCLFLLAHPALGSQVDLLSEVQRHKTSAWRAFDKTREKLQQARTPRDQFIGLVEIMKIVDAFKARDASPHDKNLMLATLKRDAGELLDKLGYRKDAINAMQDSAALFDKLQRKDDWAWVQVLLAGLYSRVTPSDETNALSSYEKALTIITETKQPQLWSQIQSNLVEVYTNLDGDRTQNVEQALAHGEAALRQRDPRKDPVNWAITQQLLAYAWLNRRAGDHVFNLSRAIKADEDALTILTPDRQAVYWASAQMNLASAYFQRAQRDGLDDLDHSIASARKAMTIFTYESAPSDWGELQLTLTKACRERSRAENDPYRACAIDAANSALNVFSPSSAPEQWADAQLSLASALALAEPSNEDMQKARRAIEAVLAAFPRGTSHIIWARAQNALGVLYLNRPHGSPEQLHLSIQAFDESLDAWGKDDHPNEWSGIEFDRGLAYRELGKAGEAAAFQEALAAFEAALSVYKSQDHATEFASIKVEIGDTLRDIGGATRAVDVEKAIQAYQDAIGALDRKDSPELYAKAEGHLGEAYLERQRGIRLNNIILATQALEAAAANLDKNRDPMQWALVQFSLSSAYYNDHRDRANAKKALQAAEAASTVITKVGNRTTWARLQANLAGIYLAQYDQMPEQLPAAVKAANNALEIFTPDANPAEWVIAERILGLIHQRSALLSLGETRDAHLKAAKDAFATALNLTARATRPSERLRTLSALVQVTADQGDWAAVQTAADDAIATAETMITDSLYEEEVRGIVQRASAVAQYGALAAARQDDAQGAWDKLEQFRARLLLAGLHVDEELLSQEDRSRLASLRDQLATLGPRENPDLQDKRQALRSEIIRLRAKAVSAQEQSPKTNVPNTLIATMVATPAGGAILIRTHESDAIGLLDQRSAPVLLAQFFGSLSQGETAKWDWLDGQGVEHSASLVAEALLLMLDHAEVPAGTRVVWIPPFELASVPLAAARDPVTGTQFIDKYELVQSPSLAVWRAASQKSQNATQPETKAAGLFNPTGDLHSAKVEELLIGGIARDLAMDAAPPGIDSATLLKRFDTATIWHFATHGHFDWADFRNSGLELGTSDRGVKERLTVGDLLYATSGVRAKMVLLTACESALDDIKESPNEFLGLPSAFLEAGAAGVVASMWKVDDLATALFAAKFYDMYINQKMSGPSALRAAQLWLRAATGDDLFQFVEEAQSRLVEAAAPELDELAAWALRLPRNQTPFADPRYWSAFVYIGN